MKRTPPPEQQPHLRLTPEERAYFEAVEAHFIRLRGRPLILSPRELERAAGWHREGIPLRVVCRGIDSYFAKRFKRPEARQRAVSLEYCEEFVHRAHEESRQLAVGGAAESAPVVQGRGELEQGLQRLLQRLQQARAAQEESGHTTLVQALERSVDTVTRLLGRQNLSVQDAEAELEPLDHEVTEELLGTTSPVLFRQVREACDAEMKELAGTMDPALYQSTLQRMTLRRLRNTSRIPEISLFAI